MSDPSEMELEKLILGYEELNPADKAVADHFLEQQPEMAARLKWHQDKENQARNAVSGSDDFPGKGFLNPDDEKAQQESLQKILAAIDARQKIQSAPLSHRLIKGSRWLLPLAAVLALVVFLPRDGGHKMILMDFTFTQIVLNAEGSRMGGQPAPAEGTLHSGQAFALDFTLTEDAFVAVYHVGPTGSVSLVYPESATNGVSALEGGRGHQIPEPESGEMWILGTETGTESFMLAVGNEWPASLEGIGKDAGSANRREILADLKSQLEDLDFQVELFEFEHVD